MKKLSFILVFAYSCISIMAQSVDLFKWSGENVLAQKQFITLGQNNSPTFTHNPITPYKTYNIFSPNHTSQYTVVIGGADSEISSGMYDVFTILDNSGKELIRRWGTDPLYNIQYITLNNNDKNYFIQVPLNNESFALIFAGSVFDADDTAGEMLIVIVNKGNATLVFDRPACAYAFTPAPNFSIEFTEKIEWATEKIEGLEIPTYVKAATSTTKHKIWKEGDMLKYKSWE